MVVFLIFFCEKYQKYVLYSHYFLVLSMYGVFLFFLAFFCVPFLWGGLSLAPWVPTFRRDHQRLIDIIKDTPGKTILEI